MCVLCVCVCLLFNRVCVYACQCECVCVCVCVCMSALMYFMHICPPASSCKKSLFFFPELYLRTKFGFVQASVLLEMVSKLEKMVHRLSEHSSQDTEDSSTVGRMALYTLMPLSRVLAAKHPVTFLQVPLLFAYLLVCLFAVLVNKQCCKPA